MRSLFQRNLWRVGLVVMVSVADVGFRAWDVSGEERVAAVSRPAVEGRVASPAEATLAQAAAANQYTFLFFYREQTSQTDAAWTVLRQAIDNFAGTASGIGIAIDDPAEKAIVARFDATRSPMPLLLAIAPNGAVTKAFPGKFDEALLRQAFVSRATASCLKGLQGRKLVLLCVQPAQQSGGPLGLPQGAADFAADPRYGQATEIVVADPSDPNEASFLQGFQLGSASAPTIVFMAPPGSVIGKFPAGVSRDQLVAKLVAAQSNPCAGGKCGPNGCGPKR